MKLHYGYPYVTAETPDDFPTVTINTYVMTSDDNTAETIQTSTFKIMGAYLADHPLDWEGDIDTAGYMRFERLTGKLKIGISMRLCYSLKKHYMTYFKTLIQAVILH